MTTGNRVRLRALRDDDAAFVLALFNDPDFLRFIGDRGLRTLDDARAHIARQNAHADYGMRLVERVSDGERLGLAGLVQRDWLPHVDVGYGFHAAHRGQGYALEAVREVVRDARERLGLAPLLAIVTEDNARSRALLKKLGFRVERVVVDPKDGARLCVYADAVSP